jgi:hypothetical protein
VRDKSEIFFHEKKWAKLKEITNNEEIQRYWIHR